MKTKNFLLIAFLLLGTTDFVKYGAQCDLAAASSVESSKNHKDREDYYRPNLASSRGKSDVPVKISYDTSKEEKCIDGKKIKVKEPELCTEEMEVVKKAALKWQSMKEEKIRMPEYSTYRPFQQVLQEDLYKNKLDCLAEPKEGSTLCAECEKCEVQIKANGEGILLRCQECFQVPSEEMVFPAGNNRKIIKLP